jgi:uncharacterized integral membrane protein
MLFLYVVIGILGAATLVFTVQNPDPVVVRFLDWQTGIFPLSFVILLAVFLGLLVASISAFAQQIHLERKIRKLRHQVSALMALGARETHALWSERPAPAEVLHGRRPTPPA